MAHIANCFDVSWNTFVNANKENSSLQYAVGAGTLLAELCDQEQPSG